MALTKAHRAPAPLDDERLREIALSYVGRYATTRSKLRAYLQRKIRSRGWNGAGEPDLEALADTLAALGYIDDAAYALAKSRALSARGYGQRRLNDELFTAGVEINDRAPAQLHAREQTLAAALSFARRRRLGPYSSVEADPPQRKKWIAAMMRAGHSLRLARAIAAMAPGAEIDEELLQERLEAAED